MQWFRCKSMIVRFIYTQVRLQDSLRGTVHAVLLGLADRSMAAESTSEGIRERFGGERIVYYAILVGESARSQQSRAR